MTTHRFSQLLATDPLVVADGAMATELEKLGVDTANQLWSATALIDHPQAIAEVHRSYFEAGAHIATTNTYQANVPAFVESGLTEAESVQLVKKAVNIAVKTRHEYAEENHQDARLLVVAASIGPYGAYLADGSEYTGNYSLTLTEFKDFHRQRMQLVDEAGADVFALETMPNGDEVRALVDLLAQEFSESEAWVSLSLKDSHHLCDGTALSELLPVLDASPQVVAVGLNCTAQENVEPALRALSALTTKPLITYPNSGEEYDPVTKTWALKDSTANLALNTEWWQAAGARVIGGCCRTAPADIAEIAAL
ncbi:homocysteine S-methyltransferase [Rothia sp. ZJ1223]|uniref:homocysteine S-methyltransferase n=1 Tax=Rothia sp. ZJ1223 TaxID=2811098 RepID=UPI001958A978|nr:homocysteine S-methyltransferase [Rothia sp. ZJ1223]MBM7052289.1 homocysteine S-methyltransferase [Rothia sp. ZJ1223]